METWIAPIQVSQVHKWTRQAVFIIDVSGQDGVALPGGEGRPIQIADITSQPRRYPMRLPSRIRRRYPASRPGRGISSHKSPRAVYCPSLGLSGQECPYGRRAKPVSGISDTLWVLKVGTVSTPSLSGFPARSVMEVVPQRNRRYFP